MIFSDWTELFELPDGALFETRDGLLGAKTQYTCPGVSPLHCVNVATGGFAWLSATTEARLVDLKALLVAHARCLDCCRSAESFISNLKVPQNAADAALQVMFGSRLLDSLRAAIADGVERQEGESLGRA